MTSTPSLFASCAAAVLCASCSVAGAAGTGWIDVDFDRDYAVGGAWTNIPATAGSWTMLDGDASVVVAEESTKALSLDTGDNILSYAATNAAPPCKVVSVEAEMVFEVVGHPDDLVLDDISQGGVAILSMTDEDDAEYLTFVGLTDAGWIELSNESVEPVADEPIVMRMTADYAKGTISYAIIADGSVLALAGKDGSTSFALRGSATQAHGFGLKGTGLVYGVTGEYSAAAEEIMVAPSSIAWTKDVGGETASATEAYGEISDEAVAAAVEGLLANQAIDSFSGTGIGAVDGCAYIRLRLTGVKYADFQPSNEVARVSTITRAVFDVAPVDAAGDEITDLGGAKLSFLLPVLGNVNSDWAVTSHLGVDSTNAIFAVNGSRYIKVVATSFSPFSYEIQPGVSPLAASVDIRAYGTGDGVVVEFQTLGENASDEDATIDVFRKLADGTLEKIGGVRAVGTGDNLYKIPVSGLEVGGTYELYVRDEEGHWHSLDGVKVTKFATEMLRMDAQAIELKWDSIPGRTYKVMHCVTLGGEWGEIAEVTASASSTSYKVWFEELGNAPTGFFRIVMADSAE